MYAIRSYYAISLVGDFTEQVQLKKIARQYNIEFEERPSPDEAALAKVVAERMTVRLEAQMRDRDKLRIERLQRFVPMVKELANDEEGVALIAMLLDDLYQQSLHALPASLDEEPARITSYNVCYTKLLRICFSTNS